MLTFLFALKPKLREAEQVISVSTCGSGKMCWLALSTELSLESPKKRILMGHACGIVLTPS